MRTVLLALTLVLAPTLSAAGRFVTVQGRDLVAPDGTKLRMRGINLGNWLVPEGYMFRFGGGPASAREINAFFNELAGPAYTARFWKEWRERYITEADIKLIRKLGFNTVRVPFHYNLDFTLLDRVIRGSRDAGIWVILDKHCAPGGQTGTNIDDSWGYPWLWESPEHQDATVRIWKTIASRYRNEPAVLGYDLLNEPIPHFPEVKKYNELLEPFYKRIVAAVREVDSDHIVILGGAQWDSNFDVFGPPFDPKSMYTFHKYWTAPTREVIEPYLRFREKYNVPLFMGESGENTDDWIAKFTAVLEAENIGWTYWPYKKMDAKSCVADFPRPVEWDAIVAYGKVPGTSGDAEKRIKVRPAPERARAALDDLLEKIRLANCRLNSGYLKALGMKTE
jgi:hypothetical protein